MDNKVITLRENTYLNYTSPLMVNMEVPENESKIIVEGKEEQRISVKVESLKRPQLKSNDNSKEKDKNDEDKKDAEKNQSEEPIKKSERKKSEKRPPKPKTLKDYIALVIDNNAFLGFMTLCTIFALFSNDMQNAFFPNTVDNSFDSVQFLLFVIFTVEILLTVLVKEDYFNSFFFWLDLISTVSLLQDISWAFSTFLNNGR
jgi:hypothetical protein